MDNLLIVKYARTDTADKEMAEVRRQAVNIGYKVLLIPYDPRVPSAPQVQEVLLPIRWETQVQQLLIGSTPTELTKLHKQIEAKLKMYGYPLPPKKRVAHKELAPKRPVRAKARHRVK